MRDKPVIPYINHVRVESIVCKYNDYRYMAELDQDMENNAETDADLISSLRYKLLIEIKQDLVMNLHYDKPHDMDVFVLTPSELAHIILRETKAYEL